MSYMSLTVGLKFTTQVVNGRTLPAVTISADDMKVNLDHLHIRIGSGITGDVMDFFTYFFKTVIRYDIEKQV